MARPLAIITGSNRGIGEAIAARLARLGFRIVLACRDEGGALAARDRMIADTGNTDIFAMKLDLGSFESIRSFVDEFKTAFGAVNVLVNNAGIFPKRRGRTVEGFEAGMGVNYWGTVLLTELLLPRFPSGGDNRIINTISNVYTMGLFSIGRMDSHRWLRSYAVSKYALLLYSLDLAERLKDRGIGVFSYHPGIVRTTIMKMGRWYDFLIEIILRPFYIDVARGAEPAARLATSAEFRGQSGACFFKLKRVKIPALYDRKKFRRRLWAHTVKTLFD